MEKLSRVKKYEDLRKSIETDNHVDVKDDAGMRQEDTLKQFDSAVLKKVEIKDEGYRPEREKVVEETPVNETVVDGDFTNEYLDDFIKEVRQYNIRKGTRESENTQVDILNQLNAVNRAKRTHYVESIQDETPVESIKPLLNKEDIALEVQNLLRDDSDDEIEEEIKTIEQDPEIDIPAPDMTIQMNTPLQTIDKEEVIDEIEEDDEVEEVEEPILKKRSLFKKKDLEETVDNEEEKTVIEPILHKKILEETQQLRVQMDEYEDELTDLSDGVEKTNKLLNFVLCFLILVLLVIIGFIAYSLLKAGGKI